jgi:lipopolysaccharide biosynthesis glycosyltransferase
VKKDLLVTLADDNYVDQARQVFSSAYWNGGWRGDYMLLACGIPEGGVQWFRDKGILVRHCEPVLTGSEKRIGHAPLTTLSKFYLFTPEFKKWKSILFLDGDTLVRGSLDGLAAIQGFGAVRILNVLRTTLKGSFHRRNENNRHLFERLEVRCDLSRPAFNSGVMAFSTDIISDEDFENLKGALIRFEEIIYISEETVLNLYFYDKWQELSQVYNICPSYEMYHRGCGANNLRGIVYHTYSNFPGGKPWYPTSPLHSEWQSNLEKADMIDITNPRAPIRTLSTTEEAEYDVYLKSLHRRHFYRFYRFKIRRGFRTRVYTPVRNFTERNFPGLFTTLRRLKDMSRR